MVGLETKVKTVFFFFCFLSWRCRSFGYGCGHPEEELCHREEDAWWETQKQPQLDGYSETEDSPFGTNRSWKGLLTKTKESYAFMSSSMRYCSSTTTLFRLGLRCRAQSSQWTTYVFLLLFSHVTNSKLNTSTCGRRSLFRTLASLQWPPASIMFVKPQKIFV